MFSILEYIKLVFDSSLPLPPCLIKYSDLSASTLLRSTRTATMDSSYLLHHTNLWSLFVVRSHSSRVFRLFRCRQELLWGFCYLQLSSSVPSLPWWRDSHLSSDKWKTDTVSLNQLLQSCIIILVLTKALFNGYPGLGPGLGGLLVIVYWIFMQGVVKWEGVVWGGIKTHIKAFKLHLRSSGVARWREGLKNLYT